MVATPAPWEVLHKFNIVAPDPRGGILSPLTTSWEAVPRVENFTLVAECRNALPDLLQEIRFTRNSNAACALLPAVLRPWRRVSEYRICLRKSAN